jgi:hypothetical protein
MNRTSLDRRQFVVLGTVAAAGMAAGVPAFGETHSAWAFVSVGYHRGARRARSARLAEIASPRFEPAARLLTGEPELFHTGARFRIHDFRRVAPAQQPERLSVEVFYDVPELGQAIPFHAWSSASDGMREAAGNSIAFDVPVSPAAAIPVVVERQTAAGTERVTIPFGVNDTGERPVKLATGVYAIALLRDGEREPDWPAVRIEGLGAANRRSATTLVVDTLDGPVPVGFDYLLVSVSYPAAKGGVTAREEREDEREAAGASATPE